MEGKREYFKGAKIKFRKQRKDFSYVNKDLDF